MGFYIKNNYGPNIEVKDGGKVTLVQGQNGLWHTVDAEEAEVVEEIMDEEPAENSTSNDKEYPLSPTCTSSTAGCWTVRELDRQCTA